MISLLTAGILFCSGMTTTYDVYLQVDTQNGLIDGRLIDSDGTYGSIDIPSEKVEVNGECLASPTTLLCIDGESAQVSFLFQNTEGKYWERGFLTCK